MSVSESRTTREQFISDLASAKNATHHAILAMKEIKKKLEEHQEDVRIAKTAGSVGGIVGTALLFTPFFFVGAAVTAGAAVTGIGAEIGDHVVNSKQGKNIIEIMQGVEECNERITKHQDNISELADELRNKAGLSEEDAYYTAWYWYAYKGTGLTGKGGWFMYQTYNAVKYIRADRVGRGVLTLQEITSMPLRLRKYAGTTAREAYTTLRGFATAGEKALGAVSVLLDVWTLIDTWSTKNPSLQSAEEALSKLEMLEGDYIRKINALHMCD